MDILEYLRSLREANTTNDLRPRASTVERPPILGPAGPAQPPSADDGLDVMRAMRSGNVGNDLRPPSVEEPPISRALRGLVEREGQMQGLDRAGALGPDIHSYSPEGGDDPEGPFLGGRDRLRAQRAAIERRRTTAQDELGNRRYPGQGTVEATQRRFRGTTPGSPEFFARMSGESMPPAQPAGAPEEPPGALPAGPARDINDETGTPRLAPGAPPRRPMGALGDRPIDTSRPVINNPDGSFSTERTITIEADGRHYVIPTIVGGKQLRDDEAVKAWRAGKNPEVGVYGSADEAENAAQARSKRIGQVRGGALADADPMGRDIHDESGTPALGQGGALEAPPGRMPAARQSLQDMFRSRVAQIEKSTGDKLTDQQKSELQLDFFLRLMSSGSKPGATLLHSVGEGGLATSALSREMRERNKTDSRQRRTEDREDAFREIGLADRDEDNQRQQRHLDITDQHYKNMDARDRERLRAVAKQVEQGKWRVVNNAKTGTVTLYDQESGATKDTGIKYERTSEKDTRSPEIQLIEHLKRNPKDLELVERLRSKDKNDSDQIIDLAGKLANDVANPRSATEALDMAREIVGGAKGQKTGNEVARPKSDEEFKQLPKGTKFVNPKDGKTYTKN